MGTVGEPINPEAWEWYYQIVGEKRCPIVDTWWQTETGAHMLTPLPGATALKPGSATRPFFGVQPVLLDNEGKIIEGAGEGNLAIKHSWPSQIRSVYGDHQRMIARQQSSVGSVNPRLCAVPLVDKELSIEPDPHTIIRLNIEPVNARWERDHARPARREAVCQHPGDGRRRPPIEGQVQVVTNHSRGAE